MVKEDLSDAPCLKWCGTKCIDFCCLGLLGIPIWGIIYLVRGGRAYIGALMIVIPLIFIIIFFAFILRMQRDEQADRRDQQEFGEYKVEVVKTQDASKHISWSERRDARKMRKFDEGVAITYDKLMKRERYAMNRAKIYAAYIEKALEEIIEESEIGEDILLITLASNVRRRAKQIHKEKYPDFDTPDFSNIEERVESRIIENLDLRKLIGHYDAKRKIFTPLTLDLLIERKKLNSAKNNK